jgi:hypothetical protein
MSSQHVPNSSSFYPISFALSFTLVIYISSPRWDYNIFILGLSKVRSIVLVMGQSKKPITKEKKIELWGPHNYLIETLLTLV